MERLDAPFQGRMPRFGAGNSLPMPCGQLGGVQPVAALDCLQAGQGGAQMGIAERRIADTPLAVVDLETTGLYPNGDRVVELAVVRLDPGKAPELVVDTLITPGRPVSGTEIHGITDADVRNAPTFEQVAGTLIEALAGSVFASYNVYFDSKFMLGEFQRAGITQFPPYLCLMYMRPMLGLGTKCTLVDACAAHGVTQTVAHHAGADALAAACLWATYLSAMQAKGVSTFGELARLKSYKFLESFGTEPLAPSGTRTPVTLKSRAAKGTAPRAAVVDRASSLAEYWDALLTALADYNVSSDEIDYLIRKRNALKMTSDELRWLHARAFAGLLADACQDKAVTDAEATRLALVASALRTLGWAPGDMEAPPLTESASTSMLARLNPFRRQ